MTENINDRKIEHLEIIARDREVERSGNYFDYFRLKHRALPEINYEEINTSTTFMGKKLSFPLIISAMTGGDHELIRKINRNLAIAAEKKGVGLSVGSQRVMFSNQAARESFALREHAPSTLLFANLGAVQLNYGFGKEMCQEAIAVVGADALALHLNPLQEAIQPEGNTNFSGLSGKICKLAKELDKPIVLKEVGAGICAEDVQLVLDRGIRYIDVAGTGGTSWSRIESKRKDHSGQNHSKLGLVFQDWGIPTPVALEMLSAVSDSLELISSGGVRSGIDMVKSIVLGASLCGIAAPFLEPAKESPEAVCEVIDSLQREYQTAMFLLGATKFEHLFRNEELLLR